MTDPQSRKRPAGETGPLHPPADELETLSTEELRSLVRKLRRYTDDLEREIALLRRQEAVDAPLSNSSASFVRTANDAIIHLDFEGVITEWNPAAERLYGYTRKEILGKSSDIIVSPEQRKGRNRRIKKVTAGEHIEPYQTARRTKDGKRIEVEVMMSLVRDPTGEATCIST
ncbi:MAG: PAS domain S-box protein, partial [bacterium]